jgi:2-polyprenyl-6-methoxyphenol hydroxylase-like FAD-dependent oxidoreductase
MPGGRLRLYVQTTPDEYRRVGRSGLPGWAAEVLAGVPGMRNLHDAMLAGLDTVQPLTAWRYLAPAWSRPGLALLGDAAHSVHPMAAQGMNAAIADADALAEAVATGPDVDEALAEYGRAGARRLTYTARLSHSLARIATDTSWLAGAPARWLVRRGLANARLQQVLTYNMSGLGVRRFTRRDRLYLAGVLRDPHADRLELRFADPPVR